MLRRILIVLTIAVPLILAAVLIPVTARAGAWGPWNITDPADVCVRADFTVTGSGWPVHRAVTGWNTAQSEVRFRVGYGDDCADVLIHRYADLDDSLCGRTDYVRLWDHAHAVDGVVMFEGADVYLNDACSPGRVTRKWVLAHELGHAVGLDHVSEVSDSVMSDAYDAAVWRGAPGPFDTAAIAGLYGGR